MDVDEYVSSFRPGLSEYCPGIIDREGKFYECPEGHLEKLKELAGDMVLNIPKDVSPLFYLTDKLGCVIVDYDNQVRSGVLTEPQIRSLYVLEKEGLIKINLSDLKGRYLL
ncbi:MAG: hypothetical protein IJT00_04915 [Lachnospiraceae bacterium]|nr:hypothetical protein [Lachnospiraceae bacterium]